MYHRSTPSDSDDRASSAHRPEKLGKAKTIAAFLLGCLGYAAFNTVVPSGNQSDTPSQAASLKETPEGDALGRDDKDKAADLSTFDLPPIDRKEVAPNDKVSQDLDDQRIAALEDENAELREENDRLKKVVAMLRAQLEALVPTKGLEADPRYIELSERDKSWFKQCYERFNLKPEQLPIGENWDRFLDVIREYRDIVVKEDTLSRNAFINFYDKYESLADKNPDEFWRLYDNTVRSEIIARRRLLNDELRRKFAPFLPDAYRIDFVNEDGSLILLKQVEENEEPVFSK